MHRACVILLLEDNPNEVELISSALGRLNRKTAFHVVRTVTEAKQFISHVAPFENHADPDLLLVDIRIGAESGLEFVRWCKSNPQLTRVHVIVFSGSTLPKDRADAFKLGASAFEPKPLSFDELTETLSRILNEWCD